MNGAMKICQPVQVRKKDKNHVEYSLITLLEATCDQTGMLDIPYGEGRALLKGAVYK